MTLKELIELFLKYKEKRVKDSTLYNYKFFINLTRCAS